MTYPSATRELWILYDSTCPFCSWCRDWLSARPALVPIRFLCCRSPMAREHFGRLPLVDDLVVVDDSGRWWSGPGAFAMCLWALDAYRALAWWLSSDLVWWLARRVFEALGRQRDQLGWLVGADCSHGSCAAPAGPGAYR